MNNTFKVLLIFSLLVFSSCKDDELSPNESVFYTGMDLSYQPMLEKKGVTYFNQNGTAIELLPFLNTQGVELIRLRLWHTPSTTHSSLQEVIAYSKRVKQAGMDVLLDIHYSDTWADPGHQTIPQAWEGLTINDLADSVYQYTKMVLTALAAENALPTMVQIGNETNSGFLWDQGRVWGDFQSNWGNYAQLINQAAKAIEEQAALSQQEIATMLHIAGVVNKQSFFQEIERQGVDYDVIGLSHYHYFHTRDLTALENQLHVLANTFKKPIMLVETNYPWTLQWNDWTHNWVGTEEVLIEGFAATPAGQQAYMEKMVEILKGIPNNRGLGFCWWAPDLVAFDGTQSTEGSFMENLTTFDFNHQALPVFTVFQNH
ncbi:MAG: glycoside hydrolase family 53 protein [Flammeovirgaceae bacterium]